jgi:hypothetical protein
MAREGGGRGADGWRGNVPPQITTIRDFGDFGWRYLQNEATFTRLSRLVRLWRQSLEAFPLAPAPARSGGLRMWEDRRWGYRRSVTGQHILREHTLYETLETLGGGTFKMKRPSRDFRDL